MEDCEYIVIDGFPTSDSPVAQSALMIADLALIPIVPTPLDMWASIGIKKGIEDASVMNESLKSRLVVNQCQPNTRLTKDVLDLLPKFCNKDGKKSASSKHRVSSECCIWTDRTWFGAKASPAMDEVEMLVKEVLELLGNKKG